MTSTSLGDLRAARPVRRPVVPSVDGPGTDAMVRPGLCAECVASLPFFAGAILVQTVVKNDHAHPHTHDERLLWQSNVYLNVVLVYAVFEAVFPIVRRGVCGGTVFAVGLRCDYTALWAAAAIMMVPIELYDADADVVTSLDRVVLYGLLSLGFLVRALDVVRLGHELDAR